MNKFIQEAKSFMMQIKPKARKRRMSKDQMVFVDAFQFQIIRVKLERISYQFSIMIHYYSIILNMSSTQPQPQNSAANSINLPNTANVANPNVANPNVANPNVANPNVANPNVANPNVANPNVANPNVANPNVANPNVANPNVTNPNVTNPNVTNPSVTNPFNLALQNAHQQSSQQGQRIYETFIQQEQTYYSNFSYLSKQQMIIQINKVQSWHSGNSFLLAYELQFIEFFIQACRMIKEQKIENEKQKRSVRIKILYGLLVSFGAALLDQFGKQGWSPMWLMPISIVFSSVLILAIVPFLFHHGRTFLKYIKTFRNRNVNPALQIHQKLYNILLKGQAQYLQIRNKSQNYYVPFRHLCWYEMFKVIHSLQLLSIHPTTLQPYNSFIQDEINTLFDFRRQQLQTRKNINAIRLKVYLLLSTAFMVYIGDQVINHPKGGSKFQYIAWSLLGTYLLAQIIMIVNYCRKAP